MGEGTLRRLGRCRALFSFQRLLGPVCFAWPVQVVLGKTLQHFWLAKASPPLLLLILEHQVYPGATPVFPWSTLKQPLMCSVGTAGKEMMGLEWLDSLKEGTSHLPWQSPRAQRSRLQSQ